MLLPLVPAERLPGGRLLSGTEWLGEGGGHVAGHVAGDAAAGGVRDAPSESGGATGGRGGYYRAARRIAGRLGAVEALTANGAGWPPAPC